MASFISASLQHAPILAVLMPLLAAPLVVLFGRASLAFVISVIASVLSLAFSLYLATQVLDGSVLSYHVGGWAPPAGIEYRIDAANAFVLVVVSLIATIVLPFAWISIQEEIAEKHHTLFFSCFLLCFTGLMGVAATGDAFNIFVFLEISSLATYALVALGAEKDRRALSAAYDYLIVGTIGATFFVIGLGLLYMATGTLNLVELAERVAVLEQNRTVRSAFAFIIIGMGLKAAMYPVHRWLPGAYTYAPSAISAFLAATATKVAVYVMLRFTFSVFSAKFGFERDTLQLIILPFGVIAMFLGSIVAVYQVNLKRLLAYSSIAQIGYMLLGITLLNVAGIAATIVHLFNHAVTKGALFLAVGAIIYRIGSPMLPRMAGLGRQMPWTSAAIVIGGLSLIGVPGTAGFVSKWVLLQGALQNGMWPVAMLIVLSSLIALVYVWKVVETLYMQSALPGTEAIEAPLMLLLPTWTLIILTIWFGVDAEMTNALSRAAAEALLGGQFGGTTPATIFGVEGR